MLPSDNFEYFLNQAFSPFAILAGRDFVFTFANAAYVELMNSRQLVGKTLDEAIPELKGQPFVSILEKVFDTGIPFHVPEIAATAIFKGHTVPTTRYFNLSYTPYKNKDEVIEGIMASGYDITDEVELRKRESKQILNLQAYNLFMQAPVGFSLVMEDNHILKLANSTGLELAGKGNEVIGNPISEILPGIESQGYIDLLNSVKNSGQSISLKESPVTFIKDGKKQTIYVNLVYQPYYEGNTIMGVLSISTDVTEQVLARKEIEELKERFETMADNIPNLAWIANADGWIFWYNHTWYEYTGTTAQEMEGWGWQSVHDPDKLPSVLVEWKKSIETGRPLEMVFPIKGADNIFRHFLTRVIPIHDDKGKVIRWLGTHTDITKQKEMEKMKDDFISIASHELKTPLTTIKAYVQIAESLLQKKGDNETLGMITKLSLQVNRLTNLIDELLDIKKLQKGKLELKESFFDLNELVNEVVEDMQKTTTTHSIEKKLENSAVVYCDKNKISQVFINLISNAIKYSPGKDQILISTELQNDGVTVSVRDYGIGIPLHEKKNVFEQFYRVERGSQSTFPGMGIGLYISSEIVSRHQGKIWVDSIIGQGSTFYIWLPTVNQKV